MYVVINVHVSTVHRPLSCFGPTHEITIKANKASPSPAVAPTKEEEPTPPASPHYGNVSGAHGNITLHCL
ncbi:unnamed protein product [Caenorhabditis nigoni]